MRQTTKERDCAAAPPPERGKKTLSAFFSRDPLDHTRPALIQFSTTPLFRLEKSPEKYAHLLKKKDHEHIIPIVNYFISNSGHMVCLGGDVVKNLYHHGRKRYKTINILAIVTGAELDKYTCLLNNIISSNDGAFSMGGRYRVRKNRSEGCFKDIALARYCIEPRLVGPEKLLYFFRASTIELDLTTEHRFSHDFGVEVK